MEPAIKAIKAKLDKVVGQLKATADPDLRRTLLAEMRHLMAELDRLVTHSAASYSAAPDPRTNES